MHSHDYSISTEHVTHVSLFGIAEFYRVDRLCLVQRWEDDEWETERQYSAGSSTAEDDRNYAQDSNQGGFSGNDTWPGTSPIPGQPSAAAGNRAARRGPIDLDTVDDWD